jgi:CheY-like chemotaxis protein
MNGTILLVEDDANDEFLFKHAARVVDLTAPLQVVTDGRRAIDYLKGAGAYADRAQFPLPTLILLDLKLPLVMGMEVLKWIRAQPELQAIIVIIFTSSHLPSDVEKAYRLGANSFVAKPSAPEMLREVLVLIKEFWLGVNLSPPVAVASPRPMAKVFQSALF